MLIHKNAVVLLGVVLILVGLAFLCVMPFATTVYSGMGTRATTIAIVNDYKSITTPLDASVVEDICLRLEIKASSENCQSEMPVYAPDFFDEIKTYFSDLPRKSRTYDTVQDKFGTYLDYCATPDPDGDYRCVYDLRGDHLYPVYFYFDEDGFYYRISAKWDRSGF